MCLENKRFFMFAADRGFKVVRVENGNLYPLLYRKLEKGLPVPLHRDAWLNEKDYRDMSYESCICEGAPNRSYPVGWHTFHKLEAAMAWQRAFRNTRYATAIAEVEIAKPVAKGYQIVEPCGMIRKKEPVTVSKYIKIVGAGLEMAPVNKLAVLVDNPLDPLIPVEVE